MGKKQNNNKTGARWGSRERKEVKRQEAKQRQLERENRTPIEQIHLIEQRPGNSTKERGHLEALI